MPRDRGAGQAEAEALQLHSVSYLVRDQLAAS